MCNNHISNIQSRYGKKKKKKKILAGSLNIARVDIVTRDSEQETRSNFQQCPPFIDSQHRKQENQKQSKKIKIESRDSHVLAVLGGNA